MPTHRERMLAGEPYRADDPELVAEHERCRLLLERFNGAGVLEGGTRKVILGELLGALGDAVEIRPPLFMDYGRNTRVGPRTFMNFGTTILDCAAVTIGADVQIATHVQLLTATHPLDAVERRSGWESALPIVIGDDVWLGGGAIVCPGVTIGPRTVVGAGAVVTADLPADVLAVGAPARVVRAL